MKQGTGQVQTGAATTVVASTVIRVADLNRSVNFYRDVFGCRVALRESDTALLLTRDGFQIYLHSTGPSRRRRLAPIGVQYLMWATDSQAELKRVAARLRDYDRDTYTYSERGVTFVEGCDPDRGRVIVAYPSPSRLPRGLIASRVRGVVRAAPGDGAALAANTASAHSHRGVAVSR
ncbi:VOC family protein [Mycolicibacterium tusciae]|uniref:VOC family protein n=1 Tax=Mycolicibacterium tusciae TaxID=75922 RepID=UPI00024A35A5|nr:VOC family protein [Mycolicibacterium tusciae]